MLAGYEPVEILDGFRRSRFVDLEFSHKVDTDKNWREVHGGEGYRQVAHLALRFVTAGTSEAEVERVINVQRHSQGIDGKDYRTDTIRARLVLHEER
jgi:hypothetical protein